LIKLLATSCEVNCTLTVASLPCSDNWSRQGPTRDHGACGTGCRHWSAICRSV